MASIAIGGSCAVMTQRTTALKADITTNTAGGSVNRVEGPFRGPAY